jgi:hypothetical protein
LFTLAKPAITHDRGARDEYLAMLFAVSANGRECVINQAHDLSFESFAIM